MPNIGAFIAWGFITALFIPTGWWPNASLGQLVEPMLRYLLPLLIAMTAGRHVAGDRGGVIAAVAVMGVILGSDIPMFIGAMAIGPFAGWVIRSFDRWAEGRIPAGFEMLVNNFSVGILGIVCALIGFYAVGPVVSALTVFLSAGVSLMIEHGLLPLVAVFIEPAKVLFLNNAINHGIFSPIGIEQARQTGQSIMFLLETNPGPGLGVLLAYWAFARGAARSSAPGAIVIQFFGGIHEIYFPYVLMRPAIIVAPIVGSAAAILFYSLTGTGLTAVASPGSIIAVAAMAPKGETLLVLRSLTERLSEERAVRPVRSKGRSARSSSPAMPVWDRVPWVRPVSANASNRSAAACVLPTVRSTRSRRGRMSSCASRSCRSAPGRLRPRRR